MSVKLTQPIPQDIDLYQMRDGQIAVITQWSDPELEPKDPYVGRIVQRYKSALVTIGRQWHHSWPTIFDTPRKALGNLRVRILLPGTTLVVEDK